MGGSGNERGEEAINDFHQWQKGSEMVGEGGHKTVLMAKYWAL